MENTKSPSEAPIKKTGSRLNERAPRITLQHLDKLGHGLEKVGHLVGQTLDQRSVLDRITFETERLSHSEASSRRNSDDGGRSNKESLRAGLCFVSLVLVSTAGIAYPALVLI